MAKFYSVFGEYWGALQDALSDNITEWDHVERCKALARSIQWHPIHAGGDFSKLLKADGIRILEKVLKRISETLANEKAEELQDPSRLIEQIMHVHDLGKYVRENGRVKYNGANHEKRSAEIIQERASEIGWQLINVALLHDLALYHGLLGITRTGEVSIAFLWPILETLKPFNAARKRLFLDLLIVLTCCDSGATLDPQTKRYYLDDSRVKLYDEVSNELFAASEHANTLHNLFETASAFNQTSIRINRIVTSGSRNLSIDEQTINQALQAVMAAGLLDLEKFARTRFDHGFYVFEPLLWNLNGEKEGKVACETLEKLLKLIGVLSSRDERLSVISQYVTVSTGDGKEWLSEIGLRNTFSMRDADYAKRNNERFKLLEDSVRSGDPVKIYEAINIALHKN
jgi:hypothetical protein